MKLVQLMMRMSHPSGVMMMMMLPTAAAAEAVEAAAAAVAVFALKKEFQNRKGFLRFVKKNKQILKPEEKAEKWCSLQRKFRKRQTLCMVAETIRVTM